ncbi:MAG TPA: DUF4232 domain-containing protein [Solirubrobacteraceae bacterium]|nr:DUF4232 domain-containing protein [Solirubrobacteraceae bacterium]
MIEPTSPPTAPGPARAVRGALAPILVACALLLAACGSAASTSSGNAAATGTGSSTASTATTTITRTATTTSSSVSSTPATSQSSGPTPCTASTLALRFLGQQGATGHGELGFAVRNTGSRACRTYGYPGVQFLSASGAPLPTRSQRTTTDFFGSTPVAAIVLAPGASASFRLGVSHGAASTAGCTTARGLQVFPPDDTATLRTTISEGAYECGTVTLSPMRPGTSAYR